MTRIDAINEILLKINEEPISIDSDIDNIYIAKIANKHLEIAKRKILSQGWFFNKFSVELSPDNDGHISVSENYLSVDGSASSPNVIMRDWKLFDKSEFSYVFTDDVTIDAISDMDFEDIPSYAVANYIVELATLNTYISIIGYTEEAKSISEMIRLARIEAIKENARNKDGNVLSSAFVTTLLDRTSE